MGFVRNAKADLDILICSGVDRSNNREDRPQRMSQLADAVEQSSAEGELEQLT